MRGRWRALLRLFGVQGTWNYERMLGVGMGYAAEPLLADLAAADPTRHAEAVVRSAEFFNCHPYLAGVALGASIRAEYDREAGGRITRLRTALCGPLGSLGDQIFWAGLLPALVALALIGVSAGFGLGAIAGFLVLYNAIRVGVAFWGLRIGLASGIRVGAAVTDSWLPWAADRIAPWASFLTGLALPVTAGWYLQGATTGTVAPVVGVALGALFLSRTFAPRVTAVRLGLAALGLGVVVLWGVR